MDVLWIIWVIAGFAAAGFCLFNAVQAESGSGARIAWAVATPFAFFGGIFVAGLICGGLILWLIFEAIT